MNLRQKKSGFEARFYLNNKPKSLWLGKLSARAKREYGRRLESLVQAFNSNLPANIEDLEWCSGLPDKMRSKLQSIGLIPASGIPSSRESRRVGQFTKDFIESLSLSDRTVNNYEQARTWLLKYVDSDTDLSQLTLRDLELWINRMKDSGLAYSTREAHTKRVKTMLRAAVSSRLIRQSPADGLKIPREKKRKKLLNNFVDGSVTTKILDKLPSTQWKVIFALMRIQGFRRCEVPTLEWRHVDWSKGVLEVHSPKTGYRECPVFPEFKPILDDALELYGQDSLGVANWPTSRTESLTPLLTKRIKEAISTSWPKICQELRITRRNELERQFPRHVVNSWMGHDSATADEYYLGVSLEDIDKAHQLGFSHNLSHVTHRLEPTAGDKSTENPGKTSISNVSE